MRQTRRLQLSVGVSRPQDSSGFSTSWARYGLLRSLFQSPDAERVRDIAGLSGSFLFPVTQSEDRKFLRSFGLPVAASAHFWLGLLLVARA